MHCNVGRQIRYLVVLHFLSKTQRIKAHMALIMGDVVLKACIKTLHYLSLPCAQDWEFCMLESKWNAHNERKNAAHFFFHYVSNDPATQATLCCF